MARKIKFRCWNKELKEIWVGGYVQFDTGNILFDDEDGNTFEYTGDEFPLMQYTGLNDKNGEEIYEGDFLKHDLWGISEIIWEHGMFRGKGNDHDITLADHQLKRSRVIGNIYENPELLK